MGLYNFNSNIDKTNFYTTKYGSASISKDVNNVYSILSAGTSDREAYIRMNISNLSLGDLMTIEYDAEAVGQVSVQVRYTNPTTGVTSTLDTYTQPVNGIYKGKATFIATKKGDYIISVGVGWGTNFDGKIKNIGVSIQSISAFAPVTQPVMQSFTLITPNANGVFELRNDWSTHEGTLTTVDVNTLQLTPTLKATKRYQAYSNLMHGGTSSEYVSRVNVDEYNNVTIKFFDPVTNAVIPLASIKRYAYFGILLF